MKHFTTQSPFLTPTKGKAFVHKAPTSDALSGMRLAV